MRILGIGVATLDIINLVDRYPAEDAEIRALGQRRARGGNAANTLVVLRQLGHGCGWGGVVADEPDGRYIYAELQRQHIDVSGCVRYPGGKAPTSYICLSRATGSRTIVHYRDLPEFTAEDFRRIDLAAWDWVHFEGRNPRETGQMLTHLKRQRPRLGCSVEVEKPREGIEQLFNGPDVLIFSRLYAQARGFGDGPALLRGVQAQIGGAIIFCAWGEKGGFAMDAAGELYRSPAFVPAALVDTLGAGDVFNAGVIDGILHGRPIGQVLVDASRLAGRKCGMAGFEGLIPG